MRKRNAMRLAITTGYYLRCICAIALQSNPLTLLISVNPINCLSAVFALFSSYLPSMVNMQYIFGGKAVCCLSLLFLLYIKSSCEVYLLIYTKKKVCNFMCVHLYLHIHIFLKLCLSYAVKYVLNGYDYFWRTVQLKLCSLSHSLFTLTPNWPPVLPPQPANIFRWLCWAIKHKST